MTDTTTPGIQITRAAHDDAARFAHLPWRYEIAALGGGLAGYAQTREAAERAARETAAKAAKRAKGRPLSFLINAAKKQVFEP